MLDPSNVPDVAIDEVLARFIFQRSHIRWSDKSVKPNAFMPTDNLEASVTRHAQATQDEIWETGRRIGVRRGSALVGRADAIARFCIREGLNVRKAPEPDNPNHANIVDWPADKDKQKAIAQALAANAQFLAAHNERP